MNFKAFLIGTLATVGGLIMASTPSFAQYYGTQTYTVRPRVNGFQIRDNSGNYTNYTNRVGGGLRWNDSGGGYGNIRFR